MREWDRNVQIYLTTTEICFAQKQFRTSQLKKTNYTDESWYLDSVVHHTVLCRSYFPNTVLRRLSEEYMPGCASVHPHRWLNIDPKVPSLSAHHQL